jgi:hypothetical protein
MDGKGYNGTAVGAVIIIAPNTILDELIKAVRNGERGVLEQLQTGH